jgi:hypothetical protein
MKGKKIDRKEKNKIMERTNIERLWRSLLIKSSGRKRFEGKMNLTMR